MTGELTPQDWDAAAMLDALPELVNRYRLSDLTIVYCNAAWAAQYHVSAEEAIGRRIEEFLSEDDLDGLHSQLQVLGPERPVVVDRAARRVSGATEQWLEWVDRYIVSHDGPEVLSVGRDVTARVLAERRLAELALRDPLTGLANRRLVLELLDAALSRTERRAALLAVLYVDVDGLKVVNDTYGHGAGDLVLRETATRLRSAVRAADVVGRMGGDEFIVVYEPTEPNCDDLLVRLDLSLGAPVFVADGVAVSCSASIGQADTSRHGYDAAALLAAADAAMYATKRGRVARTR
jgi:diguanylate cyclase (GGDEF)-like protein/PAS domain S-box-containing protein